MNQVNEVQIQFIKPQDGLIAFASFVLDNKLYLSSIGIFTKLDGSGYRITYPTKKVGDTNLQIFHPITKELSEAIEEAIIKRMEELSYG